jgi:uncharacterized cysteine cluster protein YcgN (CxxCxxCC family)
MDHLQIPFWKKKSVFEMTLQEWELLCDGCGRCCLEKLKDHKTGKVYYTDLACRHLDLYTCRCKIYSERTHLVADCEWLVPVKIKKYRWLPKSCAYRLIIEGKDLARWHPLISGDPETVHSEGISVRGKAVSSIGIPEDEYEKHITSNKIWGRSAGW